MRCASRCCLVTAVVVFVQLPLARCENPAKAQRILPAAIRDEPFSLLLEKPVQEDLKLTQQQLDAITRLSQSKQAESRKQMDAKFRLSEEQRRINGGAQQPSSAEQMQRDREAHEKLRADYEQRLRNVLTPDQVKRLVQVAYQIHGSDALRTAECAKSIGLTEEQRERFAGIYTETATKGVALRNEGAGRNELQQKMAEWQRQDNERILAALAPEQKAKWHELTGVPFRGGVVRNYLSRAVQQSRVARKATKPTSLFPEHLVDDPQRILSEKSVQAELQLSDQQIRDVTSAYEDRRIDYETARKQYAEGIQKAVIRIRAEKNHERVVDANGRDLRPTPDEIRQIDRSQMDALNRPTMAAREKYEARIQAILKPDQTKRLVQIALQIHGSFSFHCESVSEALRLTRKQTLEISKIKSETTKRVLELRKAIPATGIAERIKKQMEWEQNDEGLIWALLNEKQQGQWKELTGKPFQGDLPRSELYRKYQKQVTTPPIG